MIARGGEGIGHACEQIPPVVLNQRSAAGRGGTGHWPTAVESRPEHAKKAWTPNGPEQAMRLRAAHRSEA
jgi:hypothetical protein